MLARSLNCGNLLKLLIPVLLLQKRIRTLRVMTSRRVESKSVADLSSCILKYMQKLNQDKQLVGSNANLANTRGNNSEDTSIGHPIE